MFIEERETMQCNLYHLSQSKDCVLHSRSNELRKHPFLPATIKLTIEVVFPGTEMESTVCNSNHHHSPKQLTLAVMCVALTRQSPREPLCQD